MSEHFDTRLERLEEQVELLSRAVEQLAKALSLHATATSTHPQPTPVESTASDEEIRVRGPRPRYRASPRWTNGPKDPGVSPEGAREPIGDVGQSLRQGRPVVARLEELLGGRLLAWAGGIAVLVGVAFFVAVAINRGWIDQQTRIVLAAVGSLALGGAGVWLHERGGKSQASTAIVGTSIAALYLTLVAATQLYDLVPPVVALILAFLVGSTATFIAVRWNSSELAGLGIVGALLAPPLVGADSSDGSVAFVLIALAASAGVLVWRRWDRLGFIAFLVSGPQLLLWAFDEPSAGWLAVGLAVFWALNLVAALAHELRRPDQGTRRALLMLFVANAGVAASGTAAFNDLGQGTAAELWIAALAVAQIGVAVVSLLTRRVSRRTGATLVAVGLLVADLAVGLIVGGSALAVTWAAGAVPLALLPRTAFGGKDLRGVAVLSQLLLGAVRLLAVEVTLSSLFSHQVPELGPSIAIALVAGAYFICARFVARESPALARVLDLAGVALFAYLLAYLLSNSALAIAWAASAGAALVIARRWRWQAAGPAATALLALSLAHLFAYEATPNSLIYGSSNLAGTVAISAVVTVVSGLWSRAGGGGSQLALRFQACASVVSLYALSVVIVSAFQAHSGLTTGLQAHADQSAQAILSAFWSLSGVAMLVIGLLRESRPLRLGGFALLAVALGKVFLYDLATLESLYRVLSLIALGILLLLGALAFQQIKPRIAAAEPEGAAR